MQQNQENENVSTTANQQQQSTSNGQNRPAKRTGKGSRQRKTDDYRKRVGQKQLEEKRNEVKKRLGVFDDSCAELEKSLLEMSLTLTPVAVPLPVATRGVGFAAVIEYSRMCTTWNFDAIAEICTIHQYYRVSLFLVYYKLFLAQSDQGEMSSFSIAPRFLMDEEFRQALAPVTQVPISTYNILCSIGKIEGTSVWHSVVSMVEEPTAEQTALYLYPTNIRAVLDVLADEASDVANREVFHNMNPLPGARWQQLPDVGWVLRNPDEIWPANFSVDTLVDDIHCYSALLGRVAARLPKSFLSTFSWSGRASKSGVVSMDPTPVRLSATFQHQVQRHQRVLRRRDACGNQVVIQQPALPDHVYIRDSVNNLARVVKVWSLETEISQLELISGAATFVGETASLPSRLQIQGKQQADISPGITLQRFVDVPRPKLT